MPSIIRPLTFCTAWETLDNTLPQDLRSAPGEFLSNTVGSCEHMRNTDATGNMVREENPNGISSSVTYLEHCLHSFVGPQNHYLYVDSHTTLSEWSYYYEAERITRH